MLVLYLYKNMLSLVNNIKTLIGYNPTITSITEKILMEVTNMIVVGFIHLANTFRCYDLFHCPTINLSIEGQLDWVNNILVKFFQVDACTILLNSFFNMIKDVLIRDKTQLILSHICYLYS